MYKPITFSVVLLTLTAGTGEAQPPAHMNSQPIFRPPPIYFVHQASASQPTRYDIAYPSPVYGPTASPSPSWVPQPFYGFNPRAYPPPTDYYAYFGAGAGGVFPPAEQPGNSATGEGRSAMGQAAKTDTSAQVVVKVPAGAEVWFNGWKTSSTGPVREFQSPPLGPGRYSYDIRARWQENGHEVTQNHRITVTPGTNTEVSFPLVSGG